MDEFEKHVRDGQAKFDYAFITLTFSALALSFQYSPKMGNLWPWCLILSWVAFALSAVAGGWRLIQINMHAQANVQYVRAKEGVRTRTEILARSSFGALNALDEATGKPLTETQVQAGQTKYANAVKSLEQGMLEIQNKLPKLFKAQMYAFLMALLLNGTFVAKNFLDQTGGPPSKQLIRSE